MFHEFIFLRFQLMGKINRLSRDLSKLSLHSKECVVSNRQSRDETEFKVSRGVLSDQLMRDLDDSKRSLLKYPLTYWYLKNEDKSYESWKFNQVKLVTVKTNEDLWKIYDYLELASKLNIGSDYSVFRHGILPDWEDSNNVDGGRWAFKVIDVKVSKH